MSDGMGVGGRIGPAAEPSAPAQDGFGLPARRPDAASAAPPSGAPAARPGGAEPAGPPGPPAASPPATPPEDIEGLLDIGGGGGGGGGSGGGGGGSGSREPQGKAVPSDAPATTRAPEPRGPLVSPPLANLPPLPSRFPASPTPEEVLRNLPPLPKLPLPGAFELPVPLSSLQTGNRRPLHLAGDPDAPERPGGGAPRPAPPDLMSVDGASGETPSGRDTPGAEPPPQAMRRRALENPVNILLIGSGGREHALAWAIARSPLCKRLYVAPGNPGTARHGENVALAVPDHPAVLAFCRERDVGLVVVGPEAPLVAGLVDDLSAAGIRAFGPTREAARLEGSKGYTKELCAEFGIPTAAFRRFSDPGEARAYVEERGAPIVVKADGLAAGKGVVVAMTVAEALDAVGMMLGGGLGEAGAEVVIEEYLEGEEASFFALCDGIRAIPFGTAQDHKRVGDGDTGPNTGGMGAYSPAPVLDEGVQARVMREIVEPTLKGMAQRGAPFRGILYAGLMLTGAGPKLIEYNVRFGDPECQVLMPRLRSDPVEAFAAACDGALDRIEAAWAREAALTVVMAARGYPGPVARGSAIGGLPEAEALPRVLVFQAGTRLEGDALVADGGRVLAVTALAPTITGARDLAYGAVGRIDWPDGFCRRDIGWRAVAREQGA